MKKQANYRTENGWVVCVACNFMFQPVGGSPGTAKEQERFKRQHRCERAKALKATE